MRTIWLPRIVKINENVPIIIAGNKMDLRSTAAESEMESLLTPTFMDFK
jgi:signal recognition particle receptor subunit beta